MNQATIDFILQHQKDDVRQLAFLGNKMPEVDMPFALDQIRGRQIAYAKLPRWAAIDGIVYPPHISMEQCSSEFTAQYKAELAERLLGSGNLDVKLGNLDVKQEDVSFIDLTGGFGVDFSYIAARLKCKAMYVEQQTHLCEVAKENFKRLGLNHVQVENGNGIEVLRHIGKGQASKGKHPLRLIFIDPARRDDAGNKVISLKDCTPDVTQLVDEMLAKADYVIIKLSPMLDWHRAVSELKDVREVHIVSTGNECKELLLVLSEQNTSDTLKLYCVNDGQVSVFEDKNYDLSIATHSLMTDETMQTYLYEPNASLMKAGCFGAISEQYGVKMLAQNSHLFISNQVIENFPGRTFQVEAISTFNKKELKHHLQGITKANIATRNFPLSVAELRKRFKLKDGGETYLFATTLSNEKHVLFITNKIA